MEYQMGESCSGASLNNGESLEITLRPFDLSDTEDFMVWASDDEVSRFCRFDTYTSVDQAVDFIKSIAIPHPWMRAICIGDKAIGCISVTPSSGMDLGRAEISYALASKYWGKGIATKAVKMAVNSVFSEFSYLVRVVAIVNVDNLGSQRVLEKAGFTNEGVLRKYAARKGVVDVVIFSLVSTDPGATQQKST